MLDNTCMTPFLHTSYLKDKLAKENGYNVIRVPCYYEDLSFIRSL